MRALLLAMIATGCGRVSFAISEDGGGSGGDAVLDNASGTFCDSVTPVPTFCADFDGGLPIHAGFTGMAVMRGALGAAPIAKSGTGALEASFSAQAPDLPSSTFLFVDSPSTVSSVALAYDIYYTARPSSGHVECNDIGVTVGADRFYNDLDMIAGGFDHYLQEHDPNGGTFMGTSHDIPMVAVGTWHHVTHSIDLAARTYMVTMDGATVDFGPTQYPIAPGIVSVEAGISYAINSTTDGNSVYVDNFVVNFQ